MFSFIFYLFFPSTTNIGNVLEAGWSLTLDCIEDNKAEFLNIEDDKKHERSKPLLF